MKIVVVLIFSIFCAWQVFALDNTGAINIIVTGFKSSYGKAGITLFSNEKGFPVKGEIAFKKMFADITQSSCTVVFTDIPYGKYAASVFHDENSNSKVDTNIIGMPKEGVGSSNNTKGRFGPPKYSDAIFTLDSAEKTISIKIEYLK